MSWLYEAAQLQRLALAQLRGEGTMGKVSTHAATAFIKHAAHDVAATHERPAKQSAAPKAVTHHAGTRVPVRQQPKNAWHTATGFDPGKLADRAGRDLGRVASKVAHEQHGGSPLGSGLQKALDDARKRGEFIKPVHQQTQREYDGQSWKAGRRAAHKHYTKDQQSRYESYRSWKSSGLADYRPKPAGYDQWNAGDSWKRGQAASHRHYTPKQTQQFEQWRSRTEGPGARTLIAYNGTKPKGYDDWLLAQQWKAGKDAAEHPQEPKRPQPKDPFGESNPPRPNFREPWTPPQTSPFDPAGPPSIQLV